MAIIGSRRLPPFTIAYDLKARAQAFSRIIAQISFVLDPQKQGVGCPEVNAGTCRSTFMIRHEPDRHSASCT
jgi:hypothetical protein